MPEPITVEHVPLSDIKPSPFNKRIFRKNDQALGDLAANIKENGVQQPVLLRPQNEHLELVFGERRWRASQLAGNLTIPAIIRDMDDRAARKLVITENLHREDLHPLEEADGLQELLDNGWTLAEAANELGKSTKFVAKRAQLSKLSKKWRAAIADEKKHVSQWSAAMLELIARFSEKIQDTLLATDFEYDEEAWNIQDVRRTLARSMRMIHHAPWKEDDETVDVKAGACTACPKRSDRQPELFEPEELGKPPKSGACAACLDTACWGRKMTEFLKRKEADLAAKHENVVILGDSYGMPTGSPFKKRAVASWDVQTCKKTDAGAVPALMASGTDAGQVKWVKPRSTGTKAAKALGAKPEKTLADRKAEYKRLRGRIITGLLIERLEKYKKEGGIVGSVSAAALVLAFGTKDRHETAYDGGGSPWAAYKKHLAAGLEETLHNLLLSTCRVLASRLRNTLHDTNYKPDNDKGVCDFFGWSYDDLFAEAVKLKPDPKSWAKLEASEKAGKKPGKGKTAPTKPKKAGKKPKKASADAFGICRVCGCIDEDGCEVGDGTICHWVDDTHTLCSVCAENEAAEVPA